MGEGGLCRCGSLGHGEGTGARCLGGKVGVSPGGEALAIRIRRGSESADPLTQPEPDFPSEPGFLTASWGNPACPVTEGRWPAAAFSDSGRCCLSSCLAATLLAFSASLDLSMPGLCLSTWLFTLVYTLSPRPLQARPGRPALADSTYLSKLASWFISHSPRVGLYRRGCPMSSALSVQPSSIL